MGDVLLEIDGSKGEGGGQMVRTSVAMSVLTGKDVHLTRIRENRPTNGLSRQHCAAIGAVAEMTGSKTFGNTPGSRELTFRPGKNMKYQISTDVGTAGSVSLVLQAMLLAGSKTDKPLKIDITGGTNVMWAPPIDTYNQVLFPLMKRMGISVSAEIRERGFFPEGGGRVSAVLDPVKKIDLLNLPDLGELKGVRGICFIQNLPDWITKQLINGCRKPLEPFGGADIEVERTAGISRGAGLCLVAEYENGFLGSNVMTARGRSPKDAGNDAAKDLVKEMESGATLDINTADQLLPYMALAEENSVFSVSRISRHLLSQMDTLETFLDVSFGVERRDNVYNFTVNTEGT